MEAKKEAEAVEGYRRFKQLWPRMLEREGEPHHEWLLEVKKLIGKFCKTRMLFSTSCVRFRFRLLVLLLSGSAGS
jgi:hypothetical protein